MTIDFSGVPSQGLAGCITRTTYAGDAAWIETFRDVGSHRVEACVIHLPLETQGEMINGNWFLDEATVQEDDGYIGRVTEVFGIDWKDDTKAINHAAEKYL